MIIKVTLDCEIKHLATIALFLERQGAEKINRGMLARWGLQDAADKLIESGAVPNPPVRDLDAVSILTRLGVWKKLTVSKIQYARLRSEAENLHVKQRHPQEGIYDLPLQRRALRQRGESSNTSEMSSRTFSSAD